VSRLPAPEPFPKEQPTFSHTLNERPGTRLKVRERRSRKPSCEKSLRRIAPGGFEPLAVPKTNLATSLAPPLVALTTLFNPLSRTTRPASGALTCSNRSRNRCSR
jgi:hypothetical protein